MGSETETATDGKQEEIKNIVGQHNESVGKVYEATLGRIAASTLDEGEKEVLIKRFQQPKEIGVPTLIGIAKEKPATVAMAAELFGNRFIGTEEITELFGGRAYVTPAGKDFKLPFPLLFLEELQNASDCTLIYQPASPSIIGFDEFAGFCKGMSPKSGGVLLYGDQFDLKNGKVNKKAWFAEGQYSEFRKSSIIAPNRFRIATSTEITGTANKKFMAQVAIACDWIEKSFPQSITQTMKDAIAEIRKNFKMLETTQDNNSAEFVKQIVKYKFFTLFMETGLETMWRLVAYEQATGIKLLQNMWLRNGVVEPVLASLGGAGICDSFGPFVSGIVAGDSASDLGLGFSCTGI
jgi:hypothetical protein